MPFDLLLVPVRNKGQLYAALLGSRTLQVDPVNLYGRIWTGISS